MPEVVCYKGSEISYQIARRVISIKYISLVNLIMDKEVVKELIQKEMNVNNLTRELNKLLNNEATQRQISEDYIQLQNILNAGGNASAKAAEIIIASAS
ncbi:hypothetical protein LWM68_35620 [Niabella sp. W65]|nr:hypothetical protein [Niabella sp. W65]MCH7367622.1 hypothetical protein [Niabella sp. W65]